MKQNPPNWPGPTSGISLADARRLQQDTLGFLLDAVDRYGDRLRYPIGFWDVYVLTHPDAVQHVLLDNWRNFDRQTFQFQQFARVTGEGLLTTTGDIWQSHRRLAQPAFHRQQIAGMAAGIERAVDRLAQRLHGRIRDNQGRPVEVDLDGELLRLALEIVAEALFGLDLQGEAAELSRELLALMHYVIYRSQNLLAWPTWVPTRRNRAFRRQMGLLEQLLSELVAGRRQAEPQADLLSMLLSGGELTDREIRDELATMIIAGYETVASGMGWLFKLLVEHPAVYGQLEEEIDQLPDHEAGTLLEAPYLTAVIDEAFRLYPPSWLISRRAIEADQIGRYSLPAGALLVISPYAVHRQPDFWPEPEQFRPERFLGRELPHKYAHIPFGGGPHLCIGKPLAMLEASAVAAGLLRRFRLERPGSGMLPTARPLVTLRPFPALRVRVRERE